MFIRITEIFCNNTLPPSYNYNQVMNQLKKVYCDPIHNYKKVINELTQVYCHPRCHDSCKYIAEFKEGSFLRRPIFIVQCGRYCTECEVYKVSRREHKVCHACAERYDNPFEFSYHHSICLDV